MKIYTRTGDQGETGLFGGARVRKNDGRVEAYGTLDELNAALGIVRAESVPEDIDAMLSTIQSDLFTVGAEMACEPGKEERLKMQLVSESEIAELEGWIDGAEKELPPLTSFILPTVTSAGSQLHLARAITRRAERRCLDVELVRPEVVIYLNRLSDTLFVIARLINHRAGVVETPWKGRGSD